MPFDGFDVASCPDVPRGQLRLVAGDGTKVVVLLDGSPIPNAIRWRRFELNPRDYESLSKQVRLT